MLLKDDLNRLMLLTNQISEKKNLAYQKQIILQYKRALVDIKKELSNYYEQNLTTQRLTALITKIEGIINDAGQNGLKTTGKSIQDTIQYNYSSVQANLSKALGVEISTILNSNVVNSLVVNNKLTGIDWRLKGASNINNATNIVRNEITQGVIKGKNYEVVAKSVSNQLNIAASDALRIVKTETHRASNEARILSMNDSADAAKELGFTPAKVWNGGRAFPRAHDSINGTAIPVDAQFDLPSGASADAPGLSGNPGDDVNCGCFLTFELQELNSDTSS